MKTLTITAGEDIKGAIFDAIHEPDGATFEFNGVTVTVAPDSKADLIYRDCSRAMSGYIDKSVGPYPKAELSPEETADDAKIKEENEARSKVASAEYDRKAAEKKSATDAFLAVAPALAVNNQKEWDGEKEKSSQDGLTEAVVIYAEQWGRLMQAAIDDGSSLEEVADKLSHVADTEGISGSMYGCAVLLLAKCWIHGEALRRWHNTKTQIGTEGDDANESGGVLNPALLTIR